MTIQSSLRAFGLAVLVSFTGALSACNDDFFNLNWSSNVDTTLIYSLDRPEINLPSAFDFTRRRTVEIHQPGATGEWDIMIGTEGSRLVMRVPTFYGIDSDARISVFEGMAFHQLLEAPEDTADYTAEPVPLALGNTYVIQTRLAPDQFGQSCHFFAKMQPIAIDVQLGTLEFMFDRNPLCEDLELVPEEER